MRDCEVEKLHSSPAWDEIQRTFFATGDARPVLSDLSAIIEEIAARAYGSSLAPAKQVDLAMLAVGGFGRRELFPYSDVDILILVERETDVAPIKEPLAEFVRLMWDAGLRLSHTVRTVAECAEIHEGNIELSISLLDRRLIGGSPDVAAKLEGKLPRFLQRQSRALSRRLCQLTRARHAKYQGTFYHLEPDVKETPGGLRDVHLIGWLAKLRASNTTPDEALDGPARFLESLRCFLHYQAHRDQNLLSFEAQEAIVQETFQPARETAAFMREYFRNARVVYNEARRAMDLVERSESSLLGQFRDWRSRLSNTDFTVSNERVFLRTPAQLESDPALFFRLFEFVARHRIPLAAETERRLNAHREAFTQYCSRRPLWPELRAILALPGAAIALRAMHDTGFIQALFPEWNNIVCLVVPDYYHRYTVDEHTMVTIESLGELAATQEPGKRRFAEILSEIQDVALLRFALLFHDSGKGWNSGNHSLRSAELARQAMQRIQVPADEQSAVLFLIEHHLDLSAVMSARDLDDPATARMLAERIGTIERLKLLAVMSYVDISAVNPGAMTPWRMEQLWQAYRVTHQELVRELETDRIQDVPEHLSHPATFIKGFPVRYLRTHSPAEIEAHIALWELSRPTGAAARIDRWAGVNRATIVARDMPALFAALAGAISSFGMDILKAEAFSNDQGQILDTFVFADPKRTLDLNAEERERFEETLEQVALGKLDVEKLLQGRPMPAQQKSRTIRPSVHFDSDACETATLVEIVAEDRPRLLYDLAATFSAAGCNIDVVLIDTEGRRAIDVFYVASDGRKIAADLQRTVEKRILAVC